MFVILMLFGVKGKYFLNFRCNIVPEYKYYARIAVLNCNYIYFLSIAS